MARPLRRSPTSDNRHSTERRPDSMRRKPEYCERRSKMRIFIFMLVLAAVLTNASDAARAADMAPKFDIVRNCKAEIADASGNWRDPGFLRQRRGAGTKEARRPVGSICQGR